MKLEGYLKWKKELISEDKKLGLHPVYRSESAMRRMFDTYKAAQPQKEVNK